MARKILIIGGVAGGASAAARLRRLDETAEIILLEKGPHISYSGCALPYSLPGTVSPDSLFLMTPERFWAQHRIDVRTGSEATDILREEKKVRIRRTDGTVYEESYDFLILSPGAAPILPPIPGIDSPRVFTLKDPEDAAAIREAVKGGNIRTAAVIGGGFIGAEAAASLASLLEVTLIEAADQILTPFDHDMVQILQKEMLDHHVRLILHDGIAAVEKDSVRLASGRTVPADIVIMAIGVRPRTELARAAGLTIGKSGAIAVDTDGRTSDPFIFAVGDAAEVALPLKHTTGRLSLAFPAQLEARRAADAVCGRPSPSRGYLGSFGIELFGLRGAATGLNEKEIEALGIPHDFAYVIPFDRVSLMPGASPLHLKVHFEKPTGRILGAQAVGQDAPNRRIDVIAAVIAKGGTLEDLASIDLCYAPPFATAKDAVHLAGLVGLNLLHGEFRQVPVSAVRGLAENGAAIIDVREPGEHAAGHIKNAVNIPLSQIRDRLDEIPKDRPVYLHCRSGQRSYYACRILTACGFRDVYNIAGSYLALCLYEYAEDRLTGREPIVTKYNFQ